MLNFLAQAYDANNFWQVNPAKGWGDPKAWVGIIAGLIIMGLMLASPTRMRKVYVWATTFVTGLFYVLLYLWPTPVNRKPDDLPKDAIDGVGFWLGDALTHVGRFSNVITAFLLGLGIFSLLRIHVTRLGKKQKDWAFSLVLVVSFALMLFYGIRDYSIREAAGDKMNSMANWTSELYIYDFLFDGLYQQMEAAMFSIIAFFILSAAYRAFRIRSIESTILLSAALIMMLSLMGLVAGASESLVNSITGGNPNSVLNNLKLTELAGWLEGMFQAPSLRAINFGIAIGALAMGLRLWLGLERSGVSS